MNELIKQNKGLVVSIAKRYQNRGLDLEDLIQEGYIGLLRANRTYSSDKGTKFSTYATPWIRAAICEAIKNTGSLIRIPYHKNTMITPNYKELELQVSEGIDKQGILDFYAKFNSMFTEKGGINKIPLRFKPLFIYLRNGYDMAEIGRRMCISRERVRQIVDKYKDTIKRNINK